MPTEWRAPQVACTCILLGAAGHQNGRRPDTHEKNVSRGRVLISYPLSHVALLCRVPLSPVATSYVKQLREANYLSPGIENTQQFGWLSGSCHGTP